MKFCASFKPIHCKLFLGLYNAWEIFLAVYQSSKTDSSPRRGGEQHSVVLCCSVIPASLPAACWSCLTRRQKGLAFCHGTDEGVCSWHNLCREDASSLAHILFKGGYQFLVCYHFPCNFFIMNISFHIGFYKQNCILSFYVSMFLAVISQPSQVYVIECQYMYIKETEQVSVECWMSRVVVLFWGLMEVNIF